MFTFNGKTYDNVWFTSDEHYNSDRHLIFSRRLEYTGNFSQYKKMKTIEDLSVSDGMKTLIMKSAIYGAPISNSPTANMTVDIMYRHNISVGKNDIVFHLGDFGDYNVSKDLIGDHILVMGNYEYDDMKAKHDNSIIRFRDHIINNYNFKDVHENITIDTSNPDTPLFVLDRVRDEIGVIFITHKPTDCIFNRDDITPVKSYNDKLIMNLFGHVHEKGKVKRFGLNVGVDCNHFYPMSSIDAEFYLNAILHHYDEDVFI